MSANRLLSNMIWNKKASRIQLTKIGRVFMLLVFVLSLVGGSATGIQAATAITFTAEELLGRPTDTSITINIVPASTIEYHYQYGTVFRGLHCDDIQLYCHRRPAASIVISGLTAEYTLLLPDALSFAWGERLG